MTLLYDIALFFYHLAIRAAAPFHLKARQMVAGRRNWQEQLRQKRLPGEKYVWVHCASLGEFEQGRPLIEALRKELPALKIALTFFSPSGYEIRKNYPLADIVTYLPFDTRRNARIFADLLQPEAVFFVKYEFWFHHLNTLHEAGIPVYLVSGIFRKNQSFFEESPWGCWYRQVLASFTHLFVQDEASALLLRSVDINQCTVTGDTRFDRVATLSKSSQPLPLVEKFCAGKLLLVAGSTWKPDEELLVPFIEASRGWKFIIVPHEVTPANINRLTRMLKTPPLLYSQANTSNIDQFDVLVIDSVGLLSSIYQYGTIAYIGGGFGVGIHNILEAATYGLPLFFGPNYTKFREAVQLTELGAAFPITTTEAFMARLSGLTSLPETMQKARLTASSYVKNNLGATLKILTTVFPEAGTTPPAVVGN